MATVLEAWFYETAHVCVERPPPPPQPPSTADTAVPRYSVLASFNAKCSGRRHCTFRLREDHPNVWRPGVVFVRYRCIEREAVTRYCSEVVTAPHGYLTNPGYPHYYPGQVNCSWHVRAHPGQHLRVTVHDLDVRGIRQGGDVCTDFLRVSEGRRVLSLECGALQESRVVTSRGPEVTVTLWGQGQALFPHRGALVEFTAVGCPTPPPPRDGYLVFRNETHAFFSCCVNFVFGDTLVKERLLRCVDGRGWSVSLPRQCIDVRLLMEYANSTVRRELERELVTAPPADTRPVHVRTDNLFVDTILPILILVGLMLGNCVIVAVILKYRRRDRDRAREGTGGGGRELVDLSDPDPRTV
ncbi:uncharacterized protein LOC122388114 isoform X2 [Amphibalanus amphitrite]|nr:uncharacterized protein LOC122388114 isoform X2 [Amphibalanus amphitrite]